jgi:hypothetical protein
MTHTVHKIRFGDEFPGNKNQLDGENRVIADGYGMYQYYFKVRLELNIELCVCVCVCVVFLFVLRTGITLTQKILFIFNKIDLLVI